MNIEPTIKYVEDLCEAFYNAYAQTEEALGIDVTYHFWADLPDDMKEPTRMAVRTVLEYIQTDIKTHVHAGEPDTTLTAGEMATGQIKEHLGEQANKYQLTMFDVDQPKLWDYWEEGHSD